MYFRHILIKRLRQVVDLDLQASRNTQDSPSTPRTAFGLEPSSSDFVFSLFSSHKVKRKETARKQPPLQKPKLQLPRQHATTSGAATSGFLGPSPSYTGVFGAPPFLCTDAPHAVSRVPLFAVAVRSLSLWVASPGVMSQSPASLGRFLGSPSLRAFHHCPVAGGHRPTVPRGR